MSKCSDPRHANLQIDEKDFDAAKYEEKNVHSIYESIALHFSNTRSKPWPLIPAFLNSLPSGSIGADLGCGNGKYLSLRSVIMGKMDQQGIILGNDILTLGLDRSSNLIDLAAHNVVLGERITAKVGDSHRDRQNEVGVGDAIYSSFRTGCFDYALSIATVHHFSTHQRRVQAVKELIRIIRPVSRVDHDRIIAEQEEKHFIANPQYPTIASCSTGRFLIYVWALEQRGESRRKFEAVEKSQDGRGRDLLVPWVLKNAEPNNQDDKEEQGEEKVFQRFYHVFEQGELELLVKDAASQMSNVEVILEVSGWEKGNWYGIWKCVKKNRE